MLNEKKKFSPTKQKLFEELKQGLPRHSFLSEISIYTYYTYKVLIGYKYFNK